MKGQKNPDSVRVQKSKYRTTTTPTATEITTVNLKLVQKPGTEEPCRKSVNQGSESRHEEAPLGVRLRNAQEASTTTATAQRAGSGVRDRRVTNTHVRPPEAQRPGGHAHLRPLSCTLTCVLRRARSAAPPTSGYVCRLSTQSATPPKEREE